MSVDGYGAVTGVPAARSVRTVDDPSQEDRLVARAQQSPAAFEPLYLQYSTPIYRFCFRQTRDVELANDLTGQVFIKALEKLHTYHPREGATFRSWLFAIARNVVYDNWRRKHPVPLADEVSWTLQDPGLSPEELAVHRADIVAVLNAIETLPVRSRDIINMRLEGLSHHEIADVLDSTESAVRSMQSRALRDLRTTLGVTRKGGPS